MILLLHNRYRWPGGEERAVADLQWLIPRELGEEVEVLSRSSEGLGARPAARGLLAGGLRPQDVADAVHRTGARVVHAHNIHPTFGWRALAAAREAGARVVLHLHNYRLVCAPGTCFTGGEDCVRCRGRRTWPGVRLNCRQSRPESVVYAAGLAVQQNRIGELVDRFVVPSAFALARLRELRAPVGDRAVVIPSVQRAIASASRAGSGEFVLFAGRLTEEKGPADAVQACRRAGLPLVVAGDGPERPALEELAAGADVRFTGPLPPDELAALRERAAVAVVPSRYEEILPLAALEAMAAGVPVVAPRAGGLAEIVPESCLVAPRDVDALAGRLGERFADAAAGEAALAVVRERCSAAAVAAKLREVYG